MFVTSHNLPSLPHKRVAQSALVAGLGLALTLGGALYPSTNAWAEDPTITIVAQHNEGATYDAYCLFHAEVSPENVATHISWASSDMETTVLAFLDDNGYKEWLATHHSGANQHNKAQNAAEFIGEQITGSIIAGQDMGKPRTTEGTSFANRLAQALAKSSAISHKVARAGEAFSGPEGYWLFVTTNATTQGDSEAGTGPLWIPLGGSLTTINEKSSVPTVTKQVRDDAASAWGQVADAHTNQDLSFQLVATLPDNLATFERYHLRFTDKLSDGLTLSAADDTLASALELKVGDETVPLANAPVTITYQNNTLTVDIPNMMDSFWERYHIQGLTEVTVGYQAHLNSSRKTGTVGNPNGVFLTYTDDPITLEDGHTKDIPDLTKVFAYRIKVLKVDQQTNEPLEHAVFTVRVADDNQDIPSRKLYVQQDGSLGSQPYRFETDQEGTFEIVGVDEGSYVIEEVAAPDGYASSGQSTQLVVEATLNEQSKTLDELDARVIGGASGGVGNTSTAAVMGFDNETGTVQLSITNDRTLIMPLTGMDGVTAASIAGAMLVLGAAAGTALRRKAAR